MLKESFYGSIGVASTSNATLVPIPGTKRGVMLDNGTGSDKDRFRCQSGSIFIDTGGRFGPAMRTYRWYYAFFFPNTNYSTYDMYSFFAYSDEAHLTYTELGRVPAYVKPDISATTGLSKNQIMASLTAVVGVTNVQWIGGVAVNPDASDPYPFKFVIGGGENKYVELWEASDLYLQNKRKIADYTYGTDHPEAALTSDGKFFWVGQNNFNNYSGTPELRNAYCEVLGIETIKQGVFSTSSYKAALSPLSPAKNMPKWSYSNLGGTNILSTLANIQVNSESQHHGGNFFHDIEDMWGRVALVAIQTYKDTGTAAYWQPTPFFTRGYADGQIPAADVERVGTAETDKLVIKGTRGVDFDGGATALISGSYIECSDGVTVSGQYDGFSIDYYIGYSQDPNPYTNGDSMKTGLAEWTRGRLTAYRYSASGSVTTQALTLDNKSLHINSKGAAIKVEVLQGGLPVTGYTQADCDAIAADTKDAINRTVFALVSWGGKSLSRLAGSYQLKFYGGTGDEFYEYAFGLATPIFTKPTLTRTAGNIEQVSSITNLLAGDTVAMFYRDKNADTRGGTIKPDTPGQTIWKPMTLT